MKRFLIIFFAIALLPFSAAAKDINAERVSSRETREISYADPKSAFGEISNHTFTFKRMKGTARRGKDAFPFGGTVVAYFAPNGKILVWAKREEKVHAGKWWIGKAKDEKVGNLICMDFANHRELGLCGVIKYFGKNIYYRAKGNVFNLRAGAAVPKVVRSHSRDLQDIADRLGM
ncbi:hypothetical protein [Maritalea mediterranea]|uniref:Uncharacterized protein n=1 Tax=Maritalea mediterranea TaxID=2909667 RepID=A0ABS9E6M3_9HYPH|nr:hypothetical protein [Maritalea mediterranea]MCF4098525.1 hypothetical protein [Maritalea mediterranea]